MFPTVSAARHEAARVARLATRGQGDTAASSSREVQRLKQIDYFASAVGTLPPQEGVGRAEREDLNAVRCLEC